MLLTNIDMYMHVGMLTGQKKAEVGRVSPTGGLAAKKTTSDTRKLARLGIFLNLLISRSWS
jgi:hypothetical protein